MRGFVDLLHLRRSHRYSKFIDPFIDEEIKNRRGHRLASSRTGIYTLISFPKSELFHMVPGPKHKVCHMLSAPPLDEPLAYNLGFQVVLSVVSELSRLPEQ